MGTLAQLPLNCSLVAAEALMAVAMAPDTMVVWAKAAELAAPRVARTAESEARVRVATAGVPVAEVATAAATAGSTPCATIDTSCNRTL